ncbi:TonB family protein [Phenylobacterium sp.]|uniref:TonB family protein n=1 Tax=Phenylobacterium sp. TaxID=1871053 RepID=UPI002C38A3BA|nr:TonB family protein [Phenylobacterium sp.]HLZ75178.1 TonB family protein [Phenylobacterium sp.]
MLSVLAAMLMQAAAPAPSVITMPDWAAKPDGRDVVAVYPKPALMAHVEGSVTIGCEVGVEGRLHECKVLKEDPAEQGFGEAALKLSAFFRMLPMTKDGHPVAGGVIRIPVRFQLQPTLIPTEPPPPGGPVLRPVLLHTPSPSDVQRAYPATARQNKLEGRGAVKCQVTSDGRLDSCVIFSEAPAGQDFGAATMTLTPLFKLREVDLYGEKVAGRSIIIPVGFRLAK